MKVVFSHAVGTTADVEHNLRLVDVAANSRGFDGLEELPVLFSRSMAE